MTPDLHCSRPGPAWRRALFDSSDQRSGGWGRSRPLRPAQPPVRTASLAGGYARCAGSDPSHPTLGAPASAREGRTLPGP
jgi:hypothetical protein